jgi:hypothetical protein
VNASKNGGGEGSADLVGLSVWKVFLYFSVMQFVCF